MLLLAIYLFSQAPVEPSVYERLGTAGAVAAVLGAWIWWLIKDRARVIAQRDELFAQVVEFGQGTTALVGQATTVIEANTLALDRAREANR